MAQKYGKLCAKQSERMRVRYECLELPLHKFGFYSELTATGTEGSK
jgi:hypothetical protein